MAFQPIFIDGAEIGATSGGLFTGDVLGGGFWTGIVGGAASETSIQSTIKASGDYAYRFSRIGTNNQLVLYRTTTGSSLWQGIFKVRRSATPNITHQIMQIANSTSDAGALE